MALNPEIELMSGRTGFQPVPAQVENLCHQAFPWAWESQGLMSDCPEKFMP
jgi:hypothetical protein